MLLLCEAMAACLNLRHSSCVITAHGSTKLPLQQQQFSFSHFRPNFRCLTNVVLRIRFCSPFLVSSSSASSSHNLFLAPKDDDDDILSLLQVIPHDLRHTILNDAKRSQLLEVILDLGKLPQAFYAGCPWRQPIRNTEVTLEELEYAQHAIGEFGSDNRAGIPGTLHRISAIRSRKGQVIGLTYRVGRAVRGQIEMIKDLLDYGESILFVGRPAVGKTTIMREISYVLSNELRKRVVIVDTSNEIGGGGDVPHPAIGDARRLQVQESSMQTLVMIEAVENHMPEVIVIDEIGTGSEVDACRNIAERGVMLIGTAHGDGLENIIKNHTLSDLVGGIECITLGDQEVQNRNNKRIKLNRRSPPTFPFLIEIRGRHYWVVHRTERSVDALLSGKKPTVEIRRRDEQFKVVIERWTMKG